jgi:hypothetical protein
VPTSRSRTYTVEVAAALVLAAWLDLLVTIEWSYPYCTQPSDGPAYPVVGLPLPYAVASHISSLEFILMPHVLALNLLLIGAALYPFARGVNRAISGSPALRRFALVVLVVLGVGIIAIRGLSLTLGHPVPSIGNSAYIVYSDLRPVGITSSQLVHTKQECKPSQFWFPGGWLHE